MKLKISLFCGLLLAGANAMACYTVYDSTNRVVYRGTETPVDMSMPLKEAVSQRFPAGSSMVFDLNGNCSPVSIAQVARPSGPLPPPGTIRMERSGRTMSPSSDAAPLLTDRETAQRQQLPHTVVAGNIVMVPGQAAARANLSTFTVIPSDTAVARAPAAPNTSVMGAGPVRHNNTVITEMRDPPMTIIQRGDNLSVQR
jgi:hypothetical protein